MKFRARCIAAIVAVCITSACGSRTSLPVTPNTPFVAATNPYATRATVVLSSGSGTTVHERRPDVVSRSIYAFRITDLDKSELTDLMPCATKTKPFKCTTWIPETAGEHNFRVTTYDSQMYVLSTADFSANIVSNKNNKLQCVLHGTVWKLILHVRQQPLLNGTPTKVPISVTAQDADGNTIVGPFSTTIHVTNTDPTHSTKVSPTEITKPGQNLTVDYDGRSIANALVQATWSNPGSYTYGSATRIYPVVPVKTFSFDEAKPDQYFQRWMAASPDGSFWFTKPHAIVHVSATGAMKEIGFGSKIDSAGPLSVDPDGNVWFSSLRSHYPIFNNFITEVTAAGSVKFFPLSGLIDSEGPFQVVFAHGAVWFTETKPGTRAQMYRMTTDGTVQKAFFVHANAWSYSGVAYGIIADSAGNFWIGVPKAIVKCTPSGDCTGYTHVLYNQPLSLTLTSTRMGRNVASLSTSELFAIQPNGKLAFSNGGAVQGGLTGGSRHLYAAANGPRQTMILRIDELGRGAYVGTTETNSSSTQALALASDGRLWFVRAKQVGYFTTAFGQ